MCKIITIYSLLQGDGAKFVSTNLAYHLATKDKNKKIALVDFDFNAPFLGKVFTKDNVINGLDNIYPKLESSTLTSELFLDNMIKPLDNLHILKGTKYISDYKKYTYEHIHMIFKLLNEIYDYIFIVCDNKFDNPATILSLHYSTNMFLVLRESLGTETLLKQQLNIINHYKNDNLEIQAVYNYVSNNLHIEEMGNILKEHQIPIIGELEYDTTSVDNIDLQGKKRMFVKKSKNNEVFTNICKHL